MSLSVDKMLVELLWSYMQIRPHKLLRISELSALVRRAWENQENHSIIKVAHSIVLSKNSWLREVTSLLETELEENQFMVWSSQMKISLSSTLVEVISQWLMLVPTQMVPNSSWLSSLATGSMASTAFLEKSLMDSQFLTLWRVLAQEMEQLVKHALLLTADNSNEIVKVKF